MRNANWVCGDLISAHHQSFVYVRARWIVNLSAGKVNEKRIKGDKMCNCGLGIVSLTPGACLNYEGVKIEVLGGAVDHCQACGEIRRKGTSRAVVSIGHVGKGFNKVKHTFRVTSGIELARYIPRQIPAMLAEPRDAMVLRSGCDCLKVLVPVTADGCVLRCGNCGQRYSLTRHGYKPMKARREG